MKGSAGTGVIFWGLLFCVAFLYLNAILFITYLEPDWENQYELRSGPQLMRTTSGKLWRALASITFPAWIASQWVYEAYYGDLVYYPLLGGIVWFGYGCLIRWAWLRQRKEELILSLIILWAALLYLGLARIYSACRYLIRVFFWNVGLQC